MPFFVMMAQTGGQLDDAVLEYVPVTGPSQMVALFTNNQVDVMLGQVIQTANMFEQGEVRNLRLRSVYLWRGFYVVAGEGITGWEDLQGERVLMPDLKTGPAYLGRASMRQAGFEPETDFTIEYLPAAQTVQMMLAGQAAAVVAAEPAVTILINKSRSEGGTPLKPAPMDLYSLYESELWLAEYVLDVGIQVGQEFAGRTGVIREPPGGERLLQRLGLQLAVAVGAQLACDQLTGLGGIGQHELDSLVVRRLELL